MKNSTSRTWVLLLLCWVGDVLPLASSLSLPITASTSSTRTTARSVTTTLVPLSMTSSATATSNAPTIPLQSIRERQTAVYDGAEWISIQHVLHQQGKLPENNKPTEQGILNVATGVDDQGRTVMGIVNNDDSTSIYEDSMIILNNSNNRNNNDKDCLATYIIALSTIYCVVPKVESVGGSTDSSFVVPNSKIVIVGGSPLAQFAAKGLAAMDGIQQVSLVTTNKGIKQREMGNNVHILQPTAGEDGNTGFCQAIGSFDAMLDTTYDERGPLNTRSPTPFEQHTSTVTNFLKERHDCNIYISTRTHSQKIMAEEGVMWGPGKTKDYVKKINPTSSAKSTIIPPPINVGPTLQAVFDAGVLMTAKDKYQNFHSNTKNEYVRGWTWTDIWEESTWPRDTSGAGNTRFGLPVKLSEIDLVDESMPLEIVEATSTYDRFERESLSEALSATLSQDDAVSDEDRSSSRIEATNPFVHQIEGIDGLKKDIVQPELDCILFVSARFCKTCKSLNPQFTRIARHNEHDDLVFAKAEASGPVGKALGRKLGVQAVPAFVFFRDGRPFGTPLSISRIPSEDLERAIELLGTGQEWDDALTSHSNDP